MGDVYDVVWLVVLGVILAATGWCGYRFGVKDGYDFGYEDALTEADDPAEVAA